MSSGGPNESFPPSNADRDKRQFTEGTPHESLILVIETSIMHNLCLAISSFGAEGALLNRGLRRSLVLVRPLSRCRRG